YSRRTRRSWALGSWMSAAGPPTSQSSSAAASGTPEGWPAAGAPSPTLTPIPYAEKIKRRCGCALSAMVDEDETMDVASVGGRKSRVMARRILSEILQPRAEEIFHLVWDEIRRAGYAKSLNSGIVLTGGGAMLEGMAEIAEQIFDLPIRRGAPTGIGGLADHVGSPVFATPVGVALYAHRNRVPESRGGGGAFSRVVSQLRSIFREFF